MPMWNDDDDDAAAATSTINIEQHSSMKAKTFRLFYVSFDVPVPNEIQIVYRGIILLIQFDASDKQYSQSYRSNDITWYLRRMYAFSLSSPFYVCRGLERWINERAKKFDNDY